MDDPAPPSSRRKARLLWRSDLVLLDGTRLPGLAIVSYANPFGGPSSNDGAANSKIHEDEADLCLALEMLRNQPLRISSFITDRGLVTEPTSVAYGHKQTQTHWVASGDVHMYIDPHEPVTSSFFQRIFCFDADFVEDLGAKRSAQVVMVSLQPSLLAPLVDSAASDPFAIVNTSTASHSEFAIFAQPMPTSDHDGNTSMPIRLVLGRRITVHTRSIAAGIASKELSRPRSFHRQQSIGSQSLHDVFSQAGLSLPASGGVPTPASNTAPRPDDPLPRGSISALLQARSKRKPSHTERHRGAEPAPTASLTPIASAGTHTPGRRGEKRRLNSDRKIAGSPSLKEALDDEEDVKPLLSPTKAIKQRADCILSELPRLNLGKQPMRAIVAPARSGTQLLDVKPVKTESVSPKLFLVDSNIQRDESVEKTNRNLIKKIVHTLLVREHGLTKSDADYIATYNQTCSGTWCTFRNIATVKPLAKDAVENVVRIHLSLYLYSSQS
ncbi:hypothetical protein NDA18_000939 [Ustilago nuda]|nr:hypothetical protein NDA18_000939 [Ustilago nuda]